MYYQDKIVVITGGNSGIGKCMAMEIASKGAKVIIWGRNKETLESTCEEAKKLGFHMDWYQCDVSSKDMIYEDDNLPCYGKTTHAVKSFL